MNSCCISCSMNCPPLKKIESSFLCSHELTVEYIMNCLTDCLRSSLMLAFHFRLSYRSRMLQMFGLKYSISWRFILMLSSHLRQSFEWSIPFNMSQPQFCISRVSHKSHTSSRYHAPWSHHPNNKFWSCHFTVFSDPKITSSPSGRNILPGTVFSNTFSLYSFFGV